MRVTYFCYLHMFTDKYSHLMIKVPLIKQEVINNHTVLQLLLPSNNQ